MKAPPISEAKFMVEEGCSAMADAETGALAGTWGGAELICATASTGSSAKKTMNTKKLVEDDLIERLNLPLQGRELTAES
jgi:hypothetical protein